MAIINCPGCGNKISDKAENCPKCGFAIQELKEATTNHSQNSKTSERKFNYLWLALITVIALIVIAAGYWFINPRYSGFDYKKIGTVIGNKKMSLIADGDLRVKSREANNTPHILDEQAAIKFITDYHKAIRLGEADTYFEENDIDFFSLKHVDKKDILNELKKSTKVNSKHEYDWQTLKIDPLSRGEYKLTFTSMYYIFYETRTDVYEIISEFILSPNHKIRSIQDLRTTKVKSIPN